MTDIKVLNAHETMETFVTLIFVCLFVFGLVVLCQYPPLGIPLFMVFIGVEGNEYIK